MNVRKNKTNIKIFEKYTNQKLKLAHLKKRNILY